MAKSGISTADRIKLVLAMGSLLAAGAILVLCGLEMVAGRWYVTLYCGLLMVMSLVSIVAYGIDKRRARRGGWRISERMLHGFELLGGWPGAMLARRWFGHKTRKVSYRLWFWAIVGVHLVLMVWAGVNVWAGE